MSTSNIELVQTVYAAFGRHDLTELTRLLSTEFTAEQSIELPWGGSYSGLSGLQAFSRALFSQVSSTLTFERFLDAGDHVVAIGWTRGRTVAGDRPFDVPIAHLWKIRDGKVIAFRPFIDNPTMLTALNTPAVPTKSS